jgi:hypothetical protein
MNLAWLDSYVQDHHAELLREAEMERLANLVIGPRRPVRARLAERLYAIAQWVEGSQHRPAIRLEA